MTELVFKGKEFVYNHHLAIPYRPLVPVPEKGIGEPRLDGNLIIHGDNLHALKSLLSMYAGKVDCIIIDPPYNTGNEGWVYNDNVNSPMIKEWLGREVGLEDGLRHDKWCAMMWPRLHLLYELLAEDGFIAIFIDQNEIDRLLIIMDEIFEKYENNNNKIRKNRKSIISRKRKMESANDSGGFSQKTDYIVVYSKNPDEAVSREPLGDSYLNNSYKDPNEAFPRGRWRPVPIRVTSGHQGGGYEYKITTPKGKIVDGPWLLPEDTFNLYNKRGRIYFGENKDSIPQRVMYDFESPGIPPSDIWDFEEATNKQAKKEVGEIFNGKPPFDTPKPVKVIQKLISILTNNKNALILDSFAGSGTTAHAVLAANRKDGGNRRFILVECEDYADEITAERVRRVINGYEFSGTQRTELLRRKLTFSTLKKADKLLDEVQAMENLHGHEFDEIKKTVKNGELIVTGIRHVRQRTEGLGGEFTYCELGEPVELDAILTGKSLPSFEALGAVLFHMAAHSAADTGQFRQQDGWLGETEDICFWLIYRPDLEWLKSTEAALTLSRARQIAASNPQKKHIVFAPARFVSRKLLAEENLNVEFAPLPYALYRVERD